MLALDGLDSPFQPAPITLGLIGQGLSCLICKGENQRSVVRIFFPCPVHMNEIFSGMGPDRLTGLMIRDHEKCSTIVAQAFRQPNPRIVNTLGVFAGNPPWQNHKCGKDQNRQGSKGKTSDCFLRTKHGSGLLGSNGEIQNVTRTWNCLTDGLFSGRLISATPPT